jgi:hypothetical protein
MKARGGGVIVNVLGAAGERPTWGYIAGSAGNASLMAFTRAMGGTSLVDRIRIVACNPGLIRTERMETMLRANAQAKFRDSERWQELIPTNPPVGTPGAVRRSRGVPCVRPGLAHRRDGRDDRRRSGALQRRPVEPRCGARTRLRSRQRDAAGRIISHAICTGDVMSSTTDWKFSHDVATAAEWTPGLREIFEYPRPSA